MTPPFHFQYGPYGPKGPLEHEQLLEKPVRRYSERALCAKNLSFCSISE
jgi:hypothetical protein